MYNVSSPKQSNIIFLLSVFHTIIIISSNYLVQLPINLFGFHSTWGSFTFPCIFITTDLTVRILGASLARKVILRVMIPALIISYIISSLFFNGNWQGISSLTHFNVIVMRIALASFMAYLLGQFLDIVVFNRLRKLKSWWIAPTASTFLGNLFDTIAFFSIAFYKSSDPFMAKHWVEIGTMDYSFKLLVCLVLFLPIYRLLLGIIMKCIAYQPTYSNNI